MRRILKEDDVFTAVIDIPTSQKTVTSMNQVNL
jgi:hypothetical protein